MSLDSKQVANHFIELARNAQSNITPMQLQKLVYIAHGYHLAFTGEPLINEAIEAWPFGPVVRSLYGEFAHFGRNPISRLAECDFGGLIHPIEDPHVKRLLDKVWKEYSEYSGWQLSNLTHQSGTPWHMTVNNSENAGVRRPDIPNDLIRKYYADEMLNRA
ncbi:MAG: Panacea domain-containing protein [Fuerstiella sp.]